jgi:hypothetical protein
MWAIKFLKGPQAGQTQALKKGEMKIGRGEECQIRLNSQGVSKVHAILNVTDDGLALQDLNSRNGSFVNGVKVRTRNLKKGDRVSFHDIIFEILDERALMNHQMTSHLPAAYDGGAALNTLQMPSSQNEIAPSTGPSLHYQPEGFAEVARHKFDTLVLPEVLRLAQSFEYKWVIGAFVMVYVILVTCLSVVPMVRVTQSSIEKESQRRAATIAQGLADRYKIALANGTSGSFDTHFADREEGVTAAFILSAADGSILAPVSRAGAYANEPFVHSARKKDEPITAQIDNDTIGSSVPIPVYDQETGLMTPKAYAMVIYNMGSLAIDNGRVISLFSQVLGIAILMGLLLFIFLYRIIEAPISSLTFQVDKALREGASAVQTPYEFESLKSLVLNINSALARVGSNTSSSSAFSKDIYAEATQLVRIMMNPAFAIDRNGAIIAINATLAGLLNVSLNQLDSSPITSMSDDALLEIVPELIQKAQEHAGHFISSPIHFKGQDLELNVQPVKGPSGTEYMIFTLTSQGEETE